MALAVPVLAFDRVSFAYLRRAERAVADLTLEVGGGEGVALLGHNGAGKTTLLRLGMALLHPTAGEVRVAGRSTRGLGPEDVAPAAGYLFQQPEAQLFERTVRAEIGFGPRQLGWPADRIEARTELLLDTLALRDAADEHPYDLPLPRRRLVALGAALAAEPVLLLLDEPTAGLDRRSRELVAEVVRGHLAAGGAAVAVTHDARFALEALGRSVVLDRGRLAGDAPTAEVLGQPGAPLPLPPHAAVAAGLGLTPRSLRLADVAAALADRCRHGG